MPKKIIQTSWACLICGREFEDKDEAVKCEKIPTTDYKFKMGEKVRYTSKGDSGIVAKSYRVPGKNVHLNVYPIKLPDGWFRDVFEEGLQEV